jgi:adenylate cyclase class IV
MDHIEWEVKHRINGALRTEFNVLVSSFADLVDYVHAVGPDTYFTNKDGNFIRYRKESFKGPNARAELTMKFKKEDTKNNIVRTEYNLRVDQTPEDTIHKMVKALGFDMNFKIIKYCDIYFFDDATVVFYTVVDVTDPSKTSVGDHFVEVEVSEEKIKHMSEDEAKEVINKYETLLAPLGIAKNKRLKRSLFEMYVRN